MATLKEKREYKKASVEEVAKVAIRLLPVYLAAVEESVSEKGSGKIPVELFNLSKKIFLIFSENDSLRKPDESENDSLRKLDEWEKNFLGIPSKEKRYQTLETLKKDLIVYLTEQNEKFPRKSQKQFLLHISVLKRQLETWVKTYKKSEEKAMADKLVLMDICLGKVEKIVSAKELEKIPEALFRLSQEIFCLFEGISLKGQSAGMAEKFLKKPETHQDAELETLKQGLLVCLNRQIQNSLLSKLEELVRKFMHLAEQLKNWIDAYKGHRLAAIQKKRPFDAKSKEVEAQSQVPVKRSEQKEVSVGVLTEEEMARKFKVLNDDLVQMEANGLNMTPKEFFEACGVIFATFGDILPAKEGSWWCSELLQKIVGDELSTLNQLKLELKGDRFSWGKKFLEKSPEDRYKKLEQLKEGLVAYLRRQINIFPPNKQEQFLPCIFSLRNILEKWMDVHKPPALRPLTAEEQAEYGINPEEQELYRRRFKPKASEGDADADVLPERVQPTSLEEIRASLSKEYKEFLASRVPKEQPKLVWEEQLKPDVKKGERYTRFQEVRALIASMLFSKPKRLQQLSEVEGVTLPDLSTQTLLLAKGFLPDTSASAASAPSAVVEAPGLPSAARAAQGHQADLPSEEKSEDKGSGVEPGVGTSKTKTEEKWENIHHAAVMLYKDVLLLKGRENILAKTQEKEGKRESPLVRFARHYEEFCRAIGFDLSTSPEIAAQELKRLYKEFPKLEEVKFSLAGSSPVEGESHNLWYMLTRDVSPLLEEKKLEEEKIVRVQENTGILALMQRFRNWVRELFKQLNEMLFRENGIIEGGCFLNLKEFGGMHVPNLRRPSSEPAQTPSTQAHTEVQAQEIKQEQVDEGQGNGERKRCGLQSTTGW